MSPYHHGELPIALVDAAVTVVRDRGVGGLSLREVARRAGVSHAAPAHHFGDRAGLLTAVAARGFGLLADALEASGAGLPTTAALERFRASGCAYVAFAVQHREHFEVMFRPELLRPDDPTCASEGLRAFQLLADRVVDAQEQGHVGGADPETVAIAAWSLVHGLATLWINGNIAHGPDDSAEDLARRVTALLVPIAG